MTVTKKELEETVSHVNMLFDRNCGIFKRFDGIDARLDKYNGNIGIALKQIEETNIKIAKTEEIAKESKKSVVDCRKYVDKLVIAVIGASATAVISLIVAIVTITSERPNV
jgi:hypothetical protein